MRISQREKLILFIAESHKKKMRFNAVNVTDFVYDFTLNFKQEIVKFNWERKDEAKLD